MTATYVALATITLTGSDSDVTFSSIPGTYRDLVFVMSAATSALSNNRLRFNGDAGNNYSYVYMLGPLQSGTGNLDTTGILIDWDAYTTTTLGQTNHITQIFDYSATNKHKTVLSRANRANATVDTLATRWANNNAITTISLTSRGGASFSTGSVISLYGIA